MSNFNKILELTSQEDLKIINAIIDRQKNLKPMAVKKLTKQNIKEL